MRDTECDTATQNPRYEMEINLLCLYLQFIIQNQGTAALKPQVLSTSEGPNRSWKGLLRIITGHALI